MAVRVVHSLEEIQVNEDQREFIAVSLRAVNFRFQNKVQMAGVVKIRAVIGDGQFMNSLYVARIFNGDGREVGKRFEQCEALPLVKPVWDRRNSPAQSRPDIDSRKRTGTANDRLRFHICFLIQLRKKACVLADVRNNHGLIILRHPAGKSLAPF